ncbi:MAG: hypothetical protein KAS93_07130 [Gammaproteobacteria bacterium]|nr:hypothetical protein [Gammaproteobacteria bacterium]
MLYFNPKSQTGIYFDSYYMSQCPQFITKLLPPTHTHTNELNNGEDLPSINIELMNDPIQHDAYSCGPWAIEFARIVIKRPNRPIEALKTELHQIDILTARKQHSRILRNSIQQRISILPA